MVKYQCIVLRSRQQEGKSLPSVLSTQHIIFELVVEAEADGDGMKEKIMARE